MKFSDHSDIEIILELQSDLIDGEHQLGLPDRVCSEPDAAFTESFVGRAVDVFPLCLVDSPFTPARLVTDGIVVAADTLSICP